jgi:hypothetical protein
MDRTFRITEYLNGLGKDLVAEFTNAGRATQPVAVGTAREKSTKDKLRSVLPAGVGVGSGFVIDSYGNTSGQCDIILYEEAFAMKFSINGDEQNAYYNCENVIAVGEVKSDASIKEVKDAIGKLKTIRELKRFVPNGYHGYRPYLSSFPTAWTSGSPIEKEDFNSEKNQSDQIFTFLLCQSVKTPPESVMKEMKQICDSNKHLDPNKIISVAGDYYTYATFLNNHLEQTCLSAMCANTLVAGKLENAFSIFVYDIMLFISEGHSVPECKSAYLRGTGTFQLSELKAVSL